MSVKIIKVNKKTAMYLRWQKESNTKNLTWKQFYEKLYGVCYWMESRYCGGDWLDKKMGEPI